MANQAKAALEAENLEAFADRGYFRGEEILACDEAGITVNAAKTPDIGGEVAASASRISAMLPKRTFTFVQPVRRLSTASRTRKMDWSSTATGATRAGPAR